MFNPKAGLIAVWFVTAILTGAIAGVTGVWVTGLILFSLFVIYSIS